MGRLIDADRLKAHYCWWAGGSKEMSIDEAKKTFDTIIDVQPTVDAEPVRHGRDIRMEAKGHCEFKCSACGVEIGEVAYGELDGGAFNYCPNCGAKMDEVEDAETN